MSANKKVILIVILGVFACLLSVIFGQYFSHKNHKNQLLLNRIQEANWRLEHIRHHSKNLIQSGNETDWHKMMRSLEAIRLDLEFAPDEYPQWRREMDEVNSSLVAYYRALSQLHDPAAELEAEKTDLQGIGLSFSKEIVERIISPYGLEAGKRIYQGEPIDPFKTRIKDTAYDLMGLHNQQQLILLELFLDWDLPGYQRKKADISKDLEKHKARLQYLNVLMGDELYIQDIIASLDQKLDNLVLHEKRILELFATLTALNDNMITTGEMLHVAIDNFSDRIVFDISRANQYNRVFGWGLLSAIIFFLVFLGAMLAKDIIQFVESLKKSSEELKVGENNLRVTLDSIGDAVIATDEKAVITRMNPAAEQLTGWTSADAVGQQLPEVFHIINAHTRKKASDPAKRVLKEGKVVGLANDTVLIDRDGKEYQIADSGAPIRDEDERTIGAVLVFRDITESYVQEQKIKESQKLLENITANVPGVVYQFKATSEHVYVTDFVSEKATEIFGLKADLQDFFNEFLARIPVDEKEGFITSIREAVDGVAPWNYEGRFIKPGGEEIWFSGNSVPHKVGETVVFYGVLMDITHRKRLEESLRLSQFCFDKANIGIQLVGEKGKILQVNEHTCRSLGYTREELCSMTIFDIDPTYDPEKHTADQKRLRKSGGFTLEGMQKRKNGEMFPVQIMVNLFKFEGKEYDVVFLEDISERKQWESDLETSERRYRDLFKEAPLMYVITENRNGQPHITDANNLFLELLGFDRKSVIDSPLADFYTQESRRELFDYGGYERALKGEFMTEERSFVTRDGRIIHTLLHALPERDFRGRVVGTRAMFLDITPRKQAEQEAKRLESALAQAQKMEAIGTLAGGIAHDFNNILSGVVGYAELSLDETDETSPLHHNLRQIYAAGIRARDLVRQILAFSRQVERTPKPLQMGPLIKEALKLLRSSLPANIDITQKIDIRTDNVMADPTQIHQIVMNLCTNAAQAMEDTGGEITIGIEQVSLSEEALKHHPEREAGDYIKLNVQDSGHGIEPEIMGMIFDPYFTTKESGKGTGLGLSVVHGIVQSYGGFVHAMSQPNQGSTFEVYLPAIKEKSDIERRKHKHLPTGDETILLVDDEPILIEVGQQALRRLGYSVRTCLDSVEALKMFRQAADEIDLVISDMTMPKMTGDKLVAQMLETRPDLPVILCTGFSNKLTDEQAAKIGVKAVAYKPLVVEKLAVLVRKVLDEAGKPAEL